MPDKTVTESHVTTIIAAIVALVLILTAAIIGVSVSGQESNSTPLISALIGIIAPTVVGLLALLRVDTNAKRLNEVHKEVNGRMNTLEDRVNGKT